LSQTKQLDNFPSFWGYDDKPATGTTWLEATTEQAKAFGANFAPPGLLISSIARSRIDEGKNGRNASENIGVFFSISTALEEYHAKSMIVASGATPKTLELPDEHDLWGVTLHNCAICDGHLYSGSDKHVLVVGGGDAALDAAILLARSAGKVTLVHRRQEFTSVNNPINLEVAKSTSNIEIMTPFVVEEWIVDQQDSSQLVGALLKNPDTDSKRKIEIDGAFVMIGARPNTEWLKSVGVAMDEHGFIQLETGTRLTFATQTSVPGIFAAGEVSDNIYKQAVTAAASGAEAAIDAERWLREHQGAWHRNPSSAIRSRDGSFGEVQRFKDESKRIKSKTTISKGLDQIQNGKECDLTQTDCIQWTVKQHPVVVFSKPWCPYCRKALEALSLAGVENPYVVDLSKYPNTQEIQASLQKMTGRRTVPNVFVGGKSIGGGDETASLQTAGKLVQLLQGAGALAKDAEHDATIQSNQDFVETCDLETEDCFKEIIQKYPIVMFSLSWCPECKRSLELLSRIGVKPHIVDLDDYKSISEEIRLHMLNLTGRRSVPNLFIGGEYIGGFKRTSEMHEQGELMLKLQNVGIL
jgi:glutaredoxin